ncbi:hypothetical protein BDP27DRAFT_1401409 [Rhodocollybia butyracea]|uniref:DUF6534 domain-containing protein n=1 Tax=Rhodocollybia butyracea TaxID=206335 RepID=A0A9P5UA26_9AGAR|nr:hypothetical protein BDP27DRAFT_1401409 [Rhodocollybia butyracea]
MSTQTEEIAATLGIWIVALFLATILYGMGILQGWLYFQWYHKDGWNLKVMVLAVMCLETVQICTSFAATYDVVIEHFGDMDAIYTISWFEPTQLLAGYLSALIVQLYFASVVYQLNGPGVKRWLFTVPIVLLAIVEIGATIAQVVLIKTMIHSFKDMGRIKWIYSLLSSASFACDVLIAVALYITLKSKRTNIQEFGGHGYFPSRTNRILHKLTVYAINRGVLTAVTAAVNLILFLSKPNTFYYFIGLLTSSKLYMNSMLASLNSRHHIIQSVDDETCHSWNSIHITASMRDTFSTTMIPIWFHK